jgi:hypothetical protein
MARDYENNAVYGDGDGNPLRVLDATFGIKEEKSGKKVPVLELTVTLGSKLLDSRNPENGSEPFDNPQTEVIVLRFPSGDGKDEQSRGISRGDLDKGLGIKVGDSVEEIFKLHPDHPESVFPKLLDASFYARAREVPGRNGSWYAFGIHTERAKPKTGSLKELMLEMTAL